jgi:hypothetical protein
MQRWGLSLRKTRRGISGYRADNSNIAPESNDKRRAKYFLIAQFFFLDF